MPEKKTPQRARERYTVRLVCAGTHDKLALWRALVLRRCRGAGEGDG